jgi:hypothetical protein
MWILARPERSHGSSERQQAVEIVVVLDQQVENPFQGSSATCRFE